MRFIADLQIHSKYSRATSPQMVVEELAKWAALKGVKVIGTGDFTHPLWLTELKEKLVEAEPGLFVGKDDPRKETRFLLTAETSHIYNQNGRLRRIHLLIWAPSFATAEKINKALALRGAKLRSDGRPIMGLDSKELVKIVLTADPRAMVIPAHAWTPWFSLFGSNSGFDALEECFGELSQHIEAIETGLSSDPAMNWRLSQIDRLAIVSNSDSHSLQRIGREANVLDADLSYEGIVGAIKSKDPKRFLFTIEFFPEEGKYHYDGHRVCGVRLAPEETRRIGRHCPRCGRPVTVGVMHRVEELADRPVGFKPANAIPFKNLVPLDEIVAEALGVETKTKRVRETYNKLVTQFGGELPLLLEGDFTQIADPNIAEGVRRVRAGELKIEPGYDGEYGKVKIFSEDESRPAEKTQSKLF